MAIRTIYLSSSKVQGRMKCIGRCRKVSKGVTRRPETSRDVPRRPATSRDARRVPEAGVVVGSCRKLSEGVSIRPESQLCVGLCRTSTYPLCLHTTRVSALCRTLSDLYPLCLHTRWPWISIKNTGVLRCPGTDGLCWKIFFRLNKTTEVIRPWKYFKTWKYFNWHQGVSGRRGGGDRRTDRPMGVTAWVAVCN